MAARVHVARGTLVVLGVLATLSPARARMLVLCKSEARALSQLRARAGPEPVLVDGPFTVDLGAHAQPQLVVLPTGIGLPDDPQLPLPCVTFDELDEIAASKKEGAWECEPGYEPDLIQAFSDLTRRHAKLLPVGDGCPTAVLAGFNMHRMKGTDPVRDTEEKVRALGEGRASGRVLDICTGLGYTAIALARLPHVERVTTIELDPAMVEMQRRNPWSRELFESERVERLVGDATELLPTLPAGGFSAVVHDPPVNAIAGDLYSLTFYRELHRVLRPAGCLFHYIGDPESKASGQLFKGVTSRLREAGFDSVKLAPRAYGLSARKLR